MSLSIDRSTVIKGVKIALGSAAAILISGLLRLDYATSAGIITLLTIQDTKTDTLRLSVHRLLSFALSMGAAWLMCRVPVYNTVRYCLFLLVVVEISYLLKWDGSVSTNAVFGTHIFISNEVAHVTAHVLLNEFGLLTIGTLMAILMNMKMPDLAYEIRCDIDYVEKELKRLFSDIIGHLSEKKELDAVKGEVQGLIDRLDSSINTAVNDMNNGYKNDREHTRFYLDYFIMRKNQCSILLHLIRSFQSIEYLPELLGPAVTFLNEVADGFSVKNDVERQLVRLDALMAEFETYPMPETRREFKARASVFHIMNEVEEFLKLKRDFYRQMTPVQRRSYFGIEV